MSRNPLKDLELNPYDFMPEDEQKYRESATVLNDFFRKINAEAGKRKLEAVIRRDERRND